jgi:hypothetical protein
MRLRVLSSAGEKGLGEGVEGDGEKGVFEI